MRKAMIRLLSATMVLVLLLPAIAPAQTSPAIGVTVNGRPLTMDVPPMVVAGRTLVPLRAIFEALGATLAWDDVTKRITGAKGDTTVILHLGSYTALVNGQSVTLDVSPAVVGGRTLVPARFIAESLGARVVWHEATKIVEIVSLIPATAITLSSSTITLREGDQPVQLTAQVHPPDATDKGVRWSSTNRAVATVSSEGVVSPVAAGTAHIVATLADRGVSAICVVTVQARPVIQLTLDRDTMRLEVGNTAELRATVSLVGTNIIWRSSNERVATVNSRGQVTAVGVGSATITVAFADGSRQASSAVFVVPTVPRVSFPRRFDLRTTGALTPVNEQGRLGTCWAVAIIDALESKVRVDGGNLEFSVNNLAVQASRQYANSFDREHGWGGMAEVGLAYLTSWRGPVLESADPYSDEEIPTVVTNTRPVKLVQGATLFPNRAHALDNDLFKRHLMEHGAIYVIKWKGTRSTFDRFYNQDTFAWYYPHDFLTPEGNGHAVTIVGWDDDFPKEAFNPAHRPPGNGAFIVRNTKGANWGSLRPGHNMGGYFFISYYDTRMGQTMFGYPNETGAVGFTRVDRPGTYDFIYQHDRLGYNDRYRASANEVAMRNDFVIGLGQNERLAAVSFYVLEADTKYEIWLHRNVQSPGAAGTRTKVAGGWVSVPGYYTVDLAEQVDLGLRERIGVEVRLASFQPVSFAIDSATGYLSKNSEARPNVSFVFHQGRWVDLHTVIDSGKACIKIFTRDRGPNPEHMLSPATMRAELDTFVNNLRHKQVEFMRGFSPEQQRVVDSAYEQIRVARSIREFNLILKRILSMAADGHAAVNITQAMALNRGGLDVEFVWLDSGLYVLHDVGTLRAGDKVLQVGNLDLGELMTTMRKTFATENDYYVRYNVNWLLRVEKFLREYGVVNLNNSVDLTLERAGRRSVWQVPINPVYRASSEVSRTDYEWRIEKENNLGYFRFNRWPNDSDDDRTFFLELESAFHDFFEQVRVQGMNNIVIDVRDNWGGWYPSILLLGEYLLEGGLPSRRPHITMRDTSNLFRGNVYYLQGYGSFSGSVLAATLFKERSRINVVGEESGERPNFNQGASFHNLVQIEGRYRLSSWTPELRSFQKPGEDTIHPDIRILRRIDDILVNRDIQLERIREITRAGNYVYTPGTLEMPIGEAVTLARGDRFGVDGNTVTLPFDVTTLIADRVWFEHTRSRERVKATIQVQSGRVMVKPEKPLEEATYHLMVTDGARTFGVLLSPVRTTAANRTLRVLWTTGNRLTAGGSFVVTFDTDLASILDRNKITITDSTGRQHEFALFRSRTPTSRLVLLTNGVLPPGRYTIAVQPGAVFCAIDPTVTNPALRFSIQHVLPVGPVLAVTSSSGNRLTPWNYYLVGFDRPISPLIDSSKITLTDALGSLREFTLERPPSDLNILLVVVQGRLMLPPGRYTLTINPGAVVCATDRSVTNTLLTFTFEVLAVGLNRTADQWAEGF